MGRKWAQGDLSTTRYCTKTWDQCHV